MSEIHSAFDLNSQATVDHDLMTRMERYMLLESRQGKIKQYEH